MNGYCLWFIDINECLNNPCHDNANCTDTEGSFDCQCNSGASGNGRNCTSKGIFHTRGFIFLTDTNGLLNVFCLCFIDINECLSNPCHDNANCTDTEGSFDCQCKVGFSGDGHNCTSMTETYINLIFRI